MNNETKKVPGVDDLGDVLEFWSLKEQIIKYLAVGAWFTDTKLAGSKMEELIDKIDSIGKKEGE